jgi:hypothetical protein
MSSNLREFKMDLKNFADQVMPSEHEKFCKFVSLNVLTAVIMKTPVDTGLARGNWQVTEDIPATSPIQHTDKSGYETLSSGKAKINLSKPIKKVLWISNNVPYIVRLEDGWSKQAPLGMLELTLAEVRAKVDSGVI